MPIDPNGDDAHYYFQYRYDCFLWFLCAGAAAGCGYRFRHGSADIGLHLQGLAAGTVYHYRVVVVQDGEEFAEPDRTFMTQGVAGGSVLSDGRAWELVSPADKKGALIEQIANGGG